MTAAEFGYLKGVSGAAITVYHHARMQLPAETLHNIQSGSSWLLRSDVAG
jgi:hypothetical protein